MHSLLAAFLVAPVYLGREGALRELVALAELAYGPIAGGQDEVVLGRRDAVLYGTGLVDLLVERHLADDELQQAQAVGRVVDGIVGVVAQPVAFDAKDAGEDAVERAHPERGGLLGGDKRGDAVAHLAGRLVREGQGQDVPGVHALLQEIGYLISEDARLAAARTGYDQRRRIRAEHGLALVGVEVF